MSSKGIKAIRDAAQAVNEINQNEAPTSPIFADCQRMAETLASQHGLSVNFGGALNLGDLKPTIEASAAGTMLIMKGICTPEEWSDVVHLTLRNVLASVLQSAEERRLSAPPQPEASKIIVPERPKLAIARQ
jgi:hypothetical protein